MNWSAPTSSFGYYRGTPVYLGGAHGGGGAGPQMSGVNAFSQGQGTVSGSPQWSPTVLYMLALIVLEMIIFGFISRKL